MISMAPNLISLVMQFLNPAMVDRIAAALDIDRSAATTAVGAAVPSLLVVLSNVASQPDGAQKLASFAMQQFDALDSFSGQIGPGAESSVIDRGSQILTALLGSRDQNSLTTAIGRFAGFGQRASASLLGMLVPVVLSTIAHQQGATRVIAPGRIAGLLVGQKDHIVPLLPAGLNNLLECAGLLDGAAARTTAAVGSDASSASTASRGLNWAALRDAYPARTPGRNYLLGWLVPAAAIVAMLVYFVPRQVEGPQPGQQGAAAEQGTIVSASEVNKQLSDAIGGLRNVLSSVMDGPTAQSAVPKLEAVAAQFDSVESLRDRLSPEQRKTVTALADSAMASLNQSFDEVLAEPGVADTLKPTINVLKAKLVVLSA
jgi:hypothetical protein